MALRFPPWRGGGTLNSRFPSRAGRAGEDAWVNEDESLRRYGLHPVGGDLDEVRELLTARMARERQRQATVIPS
jgi:hypothetical protein